MYIYTYMCWFIANNKKIIYIDEKIYVKKLKNSIEHSGVLLWLFNLSSIIFWLNALNNIEKVHNFN